MICYNLFKKNDKIFEITFNQPFSSANTRDNVFDDPFCESAKTNSICQ